MQANKSTTSLSRDVLAYVPIKLIPAITGLLSIFILTRSLMPTEYARYSTAITTTLLLVQLAGAWLSSSILYIYSDFLDTNSQSNFRRQTINLQAVVSIPVAIIAYITIYLVTQIHALALVSAVLILSQLMHGLLMTFLQSSRKIYAQAVSVALQCATQLSVLCVLVLYANGKEAASVSAVAIGLIVGTLSLYIANGGMTFHKMTDGYFVSREIFMKMIRYGMPVSLWFFATQFYVISDRILLQFLGYESELGKYASFRDLATGCASFLTMPLVMASHPIIMSKWKNKENPKEIEKILSNNMLYLMMIFAPILVMTDITGGYFIEEIFGEQYVLPATVMVLVVTSIFLGSIAIHLQKGLEVTGKTMLMAKISVGTAIFSGIVNILVVPAFGVLGGAAVVVLSSILYMMLISMFTRKILSPRIPVKILLKTVSWFLTIEIGLHFFQNMLTRNFDGFYVALINIAAILASTLIFYSMDKTIRRFVLLKLNFR